MRNPSVPGRRSDLDILRTLVVVGLVFFHTATVFDLTDDSFYIKNADRSAVLTIVGAFVAMWGMPLLWQTEMTGGWNRSVYLIVLIAGFLLAADPRFSRAVRAHAPYALALALLLFGGVAALFADRMRVGIDPGRGFEPLSVAFRLVKGLDGWMWLIAILGMAGRLVGSGGVAGDAEQSPPTDRRLTTRLRDLRARLVAYGNEAVLPFYILHEPVVVLIAFFVVPWPAGIVVKYLAISVPSLVVTLVVYELLVRRIAIMRFLFGMRPRVPAQPGARPLPA